MFNRVDLTKKAKKWSDEKTKLKETINNNNNNNNNDQMNDIPTICSKLMSKFTKTLVQHATLLDATVGQLESNLIKEKKTQVRTPTSLSCTK